MNIEKKIYLALAVLALMVGGLLLQQKAVRKDELAHSPEGSSLPSIGLSADDIEKVTKFEVVNAGKTDIVLEKSGDSWKVSKPVSAAANQANVKSFLDNLKELKAKEQLDPGKTQYTNYELTDDKAVHVSVWKGSDKALDLYFGKNGSRGQMVRLADRDGVFVATGYSSYVYTREVKNWRDTDILKLEEANVVSIALDNEHGKFSFSKNDNVWSGTHAGKAIKGFDAEKVNDLLRAFKTLSAEDFADGKSDAETGLDKPLGTVSFTLKDNAGTETIKIGKSSSGSSHYGAKVGGSTVYTLGSFASDWGLAEEAKFAKVEVKDGGAGGTTSKTPPKK